jgi:hypothetical protein
MVYIFLKSSTFATSQVLSTPRKNKQFVHYYFSFLGIILPSSTFPISTLYILLAGVPGVARDDQSQNLMDGVIF